MSNDFLIRAKNISYSYGEKMVLSDISLDLQKGDICIISGPSGSGKSTLMYLLGEILTPSSGIVQRSDSHISRDIYFGYSFVDGPFFESLTVAQNIRFLESFTDTKIDDGYYGFLLDYFEMSEFEKTPIRNLSAGQRERVGLIRSFVHKPRIVLLDEPGSNLDTRLFQKLLEFIHTENPVKNTTYCIIAHNPFFSSLATKEITLSLS